MPNNDPARKLFRNARREAWIVALVWALAFGWTVVWCYLHGYAHDEASAPTPDIVLGFPDWVFWGIMIPWLACSAFTVWFGIWGMTDDDLGDPLAPNASPHRDEGSGQGGAAHGH